MTNPDGYGEGIEHLFDPNDALLAACSDMRQLFHENAVLYKGVPTLTTMRYEDAIIAVSGVYSASTSLELREAKAVATELIDLTQISTGLCGEAAWQLTAFLLSKVATDCIVGEESKLTPPNISTLLLNMERVVYDVASPGTNQEDGQFGFSGETIAIMGGVVEYFRAELLGKINERIQNEGIFIQGSENSTSWTTKLCGIADGLLSAMFVDKKEHAKLTEAIRSYS